LKSNEAVDSEADDRLFLGGGDEPGELGFGDEPGDEEDPTTIADDYEAEEEAPGDHGQFASQDPTSKKRSPRFSK
jgi:hypothetical protein